MAREIQEAIRVLKEGGIVVFPTDTAFGIGCRVDDEKAVERLFRIRKRPQAQAAPVLVDTVKMAQDLLLPIPQEVIDKLIEPYWPGALTIVLPCNVDKVPSLVRGGGSTLGVRIPNNAILRAIIQGVGVGILGPSANFHGAKTPYKYEDLDPQLLKLVDYVFPVTVNSAKQSQEIATSPSASRNDIKQVSTVIDCAKKPWKVIREGAITLRNIKNQISKIKNIPTNYFRAGSRMKTIIGTDQK